MASKKTQKIIWILFFIFLGIAIVCSLISVALEVQWHEKQLKLDKQERKAWDKAMETLNIEDCKATRTKRKLCLITIGKKTSDLTVCEKHYQNFKENPTEFSQNYYKTLSTECKAAILNDSTKCKDIYKFSNHKISDCEEFVRDINEEYMQKEKADEINEEICSFMFGSFFQCYIKELDDGDCEDYTMEELKKEYGNMEESVLVEAIEYCNDKLDEK